MAAAKIKTTKRRQQQRKRQQQYIKKSSTLLFIHFYSNHWTSLFRFQSHSFHLYIYRLTVITTITARLTTTTTMIMMMKMVMMVVMMATMATTMLIKAAEAMKMFVSTTRVFSLSECTGTSVAAEDIKTNHARTKVVDRGVVPWPQSAWHIAGHVALFVCSLVFVVSVRHQSNDHRLAFKAESSSELGRIQSGWNTESIHFKNIFFLSFFLSLPFLFFHFFHRPSFLPLLRFLIFFSWLWWWRPFFFYSAWFLWLECSVRWRRLQIENGQKKSWEDIEKFRCTASPTDNEKEKSIRKQVRF